MSVKIRLQRRGRKKQPFYHIIVADARAPRDGRFIEKLGIYNPMTRPATIELDREKALDWLNKGAQPTDTARAILRFKGVMYRKHLLRGVQKGILSQEEADAKYNAWVDDKESKIATRKKATEDETRAYHAQLSGKVQPAVQKEEVAEAAAPAAVAKEAKKESAPAEDAATTEEVAATTEEATPVAEESKTEEVAAATAEESTEAPAEEAAEEPAAETEEAPAEETAEEPVAETEVAPAEEEKKQEPEASAAEEEATREEE